MDGLKRLLTHDVTIRICRTATGALFAAAGLAKVGDMGAFARDIHNFDMVPIVLENLLAITLPWIEVVLALALILDVRGRPAALLATGLLVVFTLAVVTAVGRGLDIECGCFGTADASRVGLRKLLENTGLTLAALVGVLDPRASGEG